MLEKVFKLSENKTDAKTEILAGITTFMTMAYILAVNPSILSATGMDSGACIYCHCCWQHLSEHCSWQSLQTIHLHWHLVWD